MTWDYAKSIINSGLWDYVKSIITRDYMIIS